MVIHSIASCCNVSNNCNTVSCVISVSYLASYAVVLGHRPNVCAVVATAPTTYYHYTISYIYLSIGRLHKADTLRLCTLHKTRVRIVTAPIHPYVRTYVIIGSRYIIYDNNAPAIAISISTVIIANNTDDNITTPT